MFHSSLQYIILPRLGFTICKFFSWQIEFDFYILFNLYELYCYLRKRKNGRWNNYICLLYLPSWKGNPFLWAWYFVYPCILFGYSSKEWSIILCNGNYLEKHKCILANVLQLVMWICIFTIDIYLAVILSNFFSFEVYNGYYIK